MLGVLTSVPHWWTPALGGTGFPGTSGQMCRGQQTHRGGAGGQQSASGAELEMGCSQHAGSCPWWPREPDAAWTAGGCPQPHPVFRAVEGSCLQFRVSDTCG